MKTNRRTEALLAQMLQELEEGETLTMQGGPSQDVAVRGHFDTLDRLNAIGIADPDYRHVAAGRERMFSALSRSGLGRRRGSCASPLNSVLKLPAALAGVLVLTVAASGASVAVGGPDVWTHVGVTRSDDTAMERSGAVDPGLDATDGRAAPEPAGEISESVASESGPDEADATSDDRVTDGAEDAQGEIYATEDEGESYDDGIASAAEPASGAELSGDVTSSAPGDDEAEDGEEISADAATPR